MARRLQRGLAFAENKKYNKTIPGSKRLLISTLKMYIYKINERNLYYVKYTLSGM